MRSTAFLLAMAAAFSSSGRPTVSGVAFDADDNRAVVEYLLSEDAIVTCEIFTNGAAVAAGDFSTATGDVCRVVSAGARSIVWPIPDGMTRRSLKGAEAVVTVWRTDTPPPYLVVDLVASNTAYYASAEALPRGGLTNDIYRTSKIVFVRIPAAGRTFSMGSPAVVYGSTGTAGTEYGREVTLSQDFWMGVFEVTQRQYENVMGSNPSVWTNSVDSPVQPFDRATFARFRGDGNWPTVRTVSATSFCGRLRSISGIDTFDMPTAAQWEYACKADVAVETQTGAIYDSNGSYIYGNIDELAWNAHNSKISGTAQPHRVGGRIPNGFGLYDMLGNAWEWVLDYVKKSDSDYVAPEIDPLGPTTGNDGKRHMRGGAFDETMLKCRASFHAQASYPNLAFNDNAKYTVRPVCTFRPPYTSVVPAGTGVRWVRDPANGMVTVAYDLDEDAIVTADIMTNGVSIGAENFLRLSGAVNREVKAGVGRVFRWMPDPDSESWVAEAEGLSVAVRKWSPDSPPDYMALDLVVTNRQLYYVSTNAVPFGVAHNRYRTGMMLFRRIPAAGVCFRMGTVSGEAGREADVEIPHYVTLTNDYYMAIYETTLMQNYYISGGVQCSYRNPNVWTNCMFSGHYYDLTGSSSLRGQTLGLSWPTNHAVDATSAIGKLRVFACDDRFDLPTEAQWEFAARAGSPQPLGLDGVVLNDVAWTFSNTPAPHNGTYWHNACVVGLKRPNAWGLYDTLGNVGEMCLDWYSDGDAYSDGEPVSDPRGMLRTNTVCVVRGGNILCGDYRYPLSQCRTGARNKGNVSGTSRNGYRLVRFIGKMPGPFIAAGE